jgi:hypothetical protein
LNNFFKLRERLNYKAILSALLFIALCGGRAYAQTITAGGQAYVTISDTAVLVAGGTYANNMRVQFTGGNSSLPNWKLTVQPLTAYFVAQQSGSGDVAQFGYGPNWPVSYFSLKLNVGASQNSWNNANSISAIGAVSTTIPLTSSEITLVERSNYAMVAQDYFAMSYNLIQSGSRQLLSLHRDNYVIVMRFRLYKQSGALVSQMDYNHQVGLWPGWLHLPQSATPAITNGILLQNGGSNVTLNFSDASAFATGVETSLNNSLQVSSSDGEYQVKVQTLSNYFSKSGATTTVPVNKIRLTATPNTSSVVSTYNPVNLSATSTTLITNSTSNNNGVVNNYNLKYSTKQNSNQDAFLNIDAGNYETQITFILNPL